MYAVVKTGGKQYRVTKDDTILVEKLDADEGQTVTLSDVMLLDDGDKVTFTLVHASTPEAVQWANKVCAEEGLLVGPGTWPLCCSCVL